MKHIGDNDSQSDFVTLLRMKSGQESEPDFVLVEHAYALPWNSQSETTLAQPRKTLFLSKLPRGTASGSGDEYIDVEKVSCDSFVLPYNVEKGRHLMTECERHVVFAKPSQAGPNTKEAEEDEDSDSDWIEKVNKHGWTDAQCNLFSSITKILDGDYLAKLTLQNTDNEPVKHRAVIDKTSGKFTQAMSLIGWDMKLAQWLHNTLLLHMSTPYIASYLEILQTLKSKIPTLIDRMISNSFSQKKSNFEAINLLLKRPWDPVSPMFNEFKPLKMENLPIVIQVPSGATMPNVPLNLRRFRFFNIQLQHLVKYVSISHTSDTSNGITVLDSIISDVRKKILEYKEQYPAQPIVLLGWGVGALLTCHISLVEKVSANICLGFPMKTFNGMRGGSDDPLLGMTTPTLFVIGQNSTDVNIESMEEFRQRLQTQTSLVVIADGGNLMKVSSDKCYIDGITQSMVDRCIVDEIGEFLTRVFNEDTNNKETPAISSSSNYVSSGSATAFTNPLPPKTSRKEQPRKRKLSPSNFSDSGNIQSSSKANRTEARTAISQNLGLKIPIGVSSVIPLLKSEKNLSMSSSSSHVHFSLASKGATNITDLPLETLDASSKRRQSVMLKDGSSTFRLQSGSDSNIDLGTSKPVASSFDSCTLSSGSSSPMATIALGALASVSRQKYQRMIQISDSSDVPLADNKNIYGWNTKPSGKVDSDIGIVGINSVANMSSVARAIDSSSSEFPTPDFEVKQVPQQNQKQYSKPILITMPRPIMSLIPMQAKYNRKSIIDVESIKDERLNQCMNGKQSMMLQNSRDFLFHYNSPKSDSSIYKPLTGRRGRPPKVYNKKSMTATATKSSGMDSSQILVTSSLVIPPTVQKGRRGRPAKNKGLTSYRPIKAMIPSSSTSKSFFSPIANQQNSDGTSKERSSMAVLTLTGNAGDGTGVEAAGKGISSLGRGVLTLAKGGTSTVRVYSASGHKHSTVSSASTNFVQPSHKTARGSLLFTNITASTIGMSKANDITTISQSSPKSTPIMKRPNTSISTGQISLNLQGISASRNVNVLSTTSLGASRPTVMILTNASREEALKNSLSSTTTTTTISSSGVKTTKSVIGLRMTVPSMKNNFELLPEADDNVSLASNAIFPLQGNSELDLLASTASELYKKENVNVVLQEPTWDTLNERNLSSIIEYKNSKNDNLVTTLQAESAPKLAPSTIKSNITIISAKSVNKPAFVKDTLTPLLPRMSTGLQSFPICSSHKVPSPKTSSIRFIRALGNQQPPMFKTATVGTTSTGKIVTKTFTVNSTNTGMGPGKSKNTLSFGRNYSDAEKKSRGTSTDFGLLDLTYQTSDTNTTQYSAKKNKKNLNENFHKVTKYGTLTTDFINKNVALKQSGQAANEFNIEDLSEEIVKNSTKLNSTDEQKLVQTSNYSNTDVLCINEKSTNGSSMSDTIPIMKIQTTTANSSLLDKNKISLSSIISEKKNTDTVDETLVRDSDSTVLIPIESSKKCSMNPIIRITTSSKLSQFCSTNDTIVPYSGSSSVTALDSDTSFQTDSLHVPSLTFAEPSEALKSLDIPSNYTDTANSTSSAVQAMEETPSLTPRIIETLKTVSIKKGLIFSIGNSATAKTAMSTEDKETSPDTTEHIKTTILADSDKSVDGLHSKKQLSKISDKVTHKMNEEKLENKQNKSRLRITRSVSKSPAEKGRSLRSKNSTLD